MSALPSALRRSTRISATAVYETVRGRTTRQSASISSLSSLSSDPEDNPRPAKRARIRGPTGPTAKLTAKDSGVAEGDGAAPKQPRRRIKASIPEPEPSDFAARVENQWKIGPHVSATGGVENAIVNAASVGANAFAIFLKSQRKWDFNALKDESVAKFRKRMEQFGYSPTHILPHGSYLVNLGNPDKQKREKSYQCFVDDLGRCEQLGLKLYNFHPGSTVGAGTIEESLSLIAECINRAHGETASVVIVLENMAGSGNVIGSRFSELGAIIQQVHDKSRVGVCLDTCHMYAAGYDITTRAGWQTTMEEFGREIGIQYLRGMHLNDSKGVLGSKKDRHENIGLGHLGLRTFAHVLADPRTRDLPLILETPAYDVPAGSSAAARDRLATEGMGVWRAEVSVLNRLSGRDLADEDDESGGDAANAVGGNEMAGLREEIEGAVKAASKLRDAKGKKASGDSKAKKKGKRKKADADKDEEAEDGHGSCCDSEH
ncbi:xylose isomerase-like protein [Trametes elegans]|nr:xylose isomerase-like protein [Trametes elegans]